MATKKHFVKTDILARFRKSQDLETHVRLVEVEGIEVIEFRDYIPSLDEYGRGYWFSADNRDALNAVVEALIEVVNR